MAIVRGVGDGPALISYTSITLDAVPDAPWQALRSAVRAGAVAALGPDGVADQTSPGRPHITLGYATEHVDIEPHFSALNNLRAGRSTMPVTSAHLLAVHQEPEGIYTWDTLAVLPLGAARKVGSVTHSAGATNIVSGTATVGTLIQGGDLHGTITI